MITPIFFFTVKSEKGEKVEGSSTGVEDVFPGRRGQIDKVAGYQLMPVQRLPSFEWEARAQGPKFISFWNSVSAMYVSGKSIFQTLWFDSTIFTSRSAAWLRLEILG